MLGAMVMHIAFPREDIDSNFEDESVGRNNHEL